MRSTANKDQPFISEFDMGITDHLLENMNDLEMVTQADYDVQKARITHKNRPPCDLLLSELKERVRKYGVWKRGMSREEMEWRLAYQDRRSTKLTRLREASDVAGFGFGKQRLTKIVGDTKQHSNVQFLRNTFELARPVFLRLTEMEEAWSRKDIPDLVLDSCLVAVDAEREWVFGVDAKRKLPKYKFDSEFLEALRSMEETHRVFWFRPRKSYASLNDFLTKHVDPSTGKKYGKLKRELYWWHGKHGDEENPVRFTTSSQKVTTNFKSGSFEPHAVAELLFQSNRNLEPMVTWDAHARRRYKYQQAKVLATQRMQQKYTSKTPQEIQQLVGKKVKMDHYFHLSYDRLRGMAVASPNKKIQAVLDDDDDE
jgi:hypothetical protein